MRNNVSVFNNEQFGQVRTIVEGNEVLFCGSDVAKALGYDQPHKAVKTHCKDEGIIYTVIDSTVEKIFLKKFEKSLDFLSYIIYNNRRTKIKEVI